MRILLLLLLAASLEVGGDALIRVGLAQKDSILALLPLLAGAVVLVAYGFMVNLTKLDFSRLMGQYIVLFFLVAQLTAWIFFKESLKPPILVGGALILAGGATLAFWH